VDRLDKSPKGL
jgi:hypothetical protein